MSAGRKILITGGAGSCGLFLTDSLLKQGYEVTVLDIDVQPLIAFQNENLTLIQGHLENRATAKDAVRGMDAVIHLAWSFSTDPLDPCNC